MGWSYFKGQSTNKDAVWRYWGDNDTYVDYDANGQLVVNRGVTDLSVVDAEIQSIISKPSYANIYIRWGELPKDKSINHATMRAEKGVSCYAAKFNPITDTFDYIEDGSLSGAALIYLIEGAHCYLITGDMVGRGSDSEPLLTNVKVLCQLKPTKDGFIIK